jgi:hypothetical protein
MNEIPYNPQIIKEESARIPDEEDKNKKEEVCSHDQNKLILTDKTISCKMCGQTFSFDEIKQRSTLGEYKEFIERIKPQLYSIPIRTEIRGWMLECENTANRIDPTEDLMISGDLISEFWDLAPLSKQSETLLLWEIAEFELFQKGCTNFKWVQKKGSEESDLEDQLAKEHDYSNFGKFAFAVPIFGLIIAGISVLIMGGSELDTLIEGAAVGVLWGVGLLFVGLFLVYIYKVLQEGYDKTKDALEKEQYAVQEIRARMAQFKATWVKAEIEEKTKFKRFFQEIYPTKEIDDLDMQFQTWKTTQKKKE